MERISISSGAKWEDIVGYSRAVRIGNVIEVAGTTAVNGTEVISPGDLYGQCIYIFKKIEKALAETGASLNDVVRTRIYVTDISKWEEAGRAHGDFFREIKPVTTMIEVSRLIDPQLLVEIEVTAICEK
jgi:enamine deaminase RidA (YjgF/YER057c/UK114 family)